MENYLQKHFTVLEQIGEGANAIVYRALQKSTQQVVAIKKLKIDKHLTKEKSIKMVSRFKRETEICTQLNHPNIVRVIDTGIDHEEYPFAVYEYVSGETLKSYIQKKGTLTANETKVLMEQVLEALSAAHEKGIVHRDLKPQNIMVFTSGAKTYVKVLDFGIGAITHQFKPFDQTQLTMTEDVLGTPIYAAPEQLRGGIPNTQSDLYAWGLITLECLTGTTVLSGNTLAEVFHQHLALSNIPLPAAIVEHELGVFLRTVLQKSLDKRSSDTKEVLARFQAINFSTLVGNIVKSQTNEENAITVLTNLSSNLPKTSKKNITVLAIKLRAKSEREKVDLETLEAVQKDQINSIKDLAIQYGGYLAMSYAHHLVVYFGYPEADDSFVRRAGKTALFIKDEIRRRNENLLVNFGISFTVKLAIHTGETLIKPNEVPEGILPELAIEQLNVTPPNRILCSEIAQQLLSKNYTLQKLHSQNSADLQGTFYELLTEKEADTLSSTLSNLVGRAIEKNKLFQYWKQYKLEKGSSFCMVHGEAGIGKSSLMANFCNKLKKERTPYVILQAVPEGQNNALKPFLGYLLQSLKLKGTNEEAYIQALTDLATRFNTVNTNQQVAVLCAWLGFNYQIEATNLQLSPQKQKQIVFQFLTLFFKHLHQEQKYALTIEDAHWLDPTSLEFIQSLAQDNSLPFFLLLSSRKKEVLAIENMALIGLEAMNLMETEALCVQVLEHKNIDSEALTYINQKANGIPLYVEELVLTLKQQEFLTFNKEKDSYVLNNTTQLSAIPAKLSDLLHARLDQLLTAKPMAQAAAVLGRFFNVEMLQKTTKTDQDTINQALLELLQAKIIIVDNQQQHGYLFRHALLRDAAYNSILNKQRKALHLNVAEVLTTLQNHDKNFEIAKHYALADFYTKAVKVGMEVAADSLSKSSDKEAIEMCKQILSWLDHNEVDHKKDDTLKTLSLLTNALMNVYGWGDQQVKEYALKAYHLIKKEGTQKFQKSSLISAYWCLFTYYHVSSQREEVEKITLEILDYAKKSKDQEFIFSSEILRGIHVFTSGDLKQGIEILKKSESNFNLLINKEPNYTVGIENFCWSSSCLGFALWLSGKKEEGRDYVDRALERARQIKHAPSECLMLFYRAIVCQWDRDKQTAKDLTDKAIEIANKFGLVAYGAYAFTINCWAQDLIEPIDQVIEQLQGMGCHLALTNYISLPAEYEFSIGEEEKAMERIEKSLKLCKQNGEFYYEKELLKIKSTFLSTQKLES